MDSHANPLLGMDKVYFYIVVNFPALIGRNLTGEFMRKIYATSWNLFTLTAETGGVFCQLGMFLNVFFHWIYTLNERQLLSRAFFYSWLVFLLGFWLRNVPLGNPISDGIVFVFHLAWCVRGFKSLKRFWPYLIAFRSCVSIACVQTSALPQEKSGEETSVNRRR